MAGQIAEDGQILESYINALGTSFVTLNGTIFAKSAV